MGFFTVSKSITFAAAHQVRGHTGGCENLHGHNWRVRATLAARELNALSMVVDFKDVKGGLLEIAARFDHRHFNEVPPFDDLNPSSERIARYFFDECARRFNDARVRVTKIEVWETDNNLATYEEAPGF